jgi:hypothetical protein
VIQYNPPIIQCPLEPLPRLSHQRILVQDHQMSSQRTHPLRPHRVTFVRHGGRADLRGFERLLDFLIDKEKDGGECERMTEPTEPEKEDD